MKTINTAMAVALIGLATTAQAETFQFEMDGLNYTFDAFETAETAAQFYSYGNPISASANINEFSTYASDIGANALTVFAHKNTINGDLSLGFVFDSLYDNSSGKFKGTLTTSGSTLAVADDNSNEVNGSNGVYNLNFAWNKQYTDGVVVTMNDYSSFEATLSKISKTNLNSLVLAGANSGVFPISYTGRDINISAVSAIPEASTITMMLGGLGLVGFMAARRKKQI